MARKERYSNPVGGDVVNLRLFTYNSNSLSDVKSVTKVEIYIDEPEGRRLVQTISGDDIVQEATGKYLVSVTLDQPRYCIGRYCDVWTLEFDSEDCPATIENPFQVYPDLWYTTPIPVVYDFAFTFRPNRMRKGSKQYLIIEVTPNVPRGTDLARYYENLAIVSDLKVSVEMQCVECMPCEADLRLVVDEAPVDYREKRYGYYLLDTADMDPGIYSVWFTMNFGESVYVSDRMNFQVYI